MKDPFSQQRKACSTIALSFDQFQLGDVSLDHAVIDPPGQTISHRVFVFLDPRGKGEQFRNLAAFYLGQPSIEMVSPAAAQHGGKLLDQLISLIDLWADLTEFDQCLLFPTPQFFRATKKEEGRLS